MTGRRFFLQIVLTYYCDTQMLLGKTKSSAQIIKTA